MAAVKRPNLVLRRIREDERQETRAEFAEALRRAAEDMGEDVEPSERYVARLEDGDTAYPHAPYRRILARVCDRSMAELGFIPRYAKGESHGALESVVAQPGADDEWPTQPASSSPVARDREGSDGRAGAAFRDRESAAEAHDGQVSAEDAIDILSRIQKLHKATVHPDVVSHLQAATRQTVVQYEKLDHASLVPVLVKQRVFVEKLLAECRHPRQQQQLCEVNGAISGVLGYVAVGRGDFSLARAYTHEAFQLGDFAGDTNLQAWARGLQSFCEYYAGRYDVAASLAEDGLNYANSGPQSVRLTINGAARAMGKLGDSEGVHRAVGAAHDLLSRNDAPVGVPSSITLECYSATQTASNAATAYVSLGMAEKAQHYVELALPQISKSDSPWSRSLVMIDLAVSLIQSESEADLDRASQLVIDALNISAGRPIISVQKRASEFVQNAIGRWGVSSQVRAVLEVFRP